MRVIKRKKSKKHIFFRLAVLALVAYVAVSLVNQQVQIRAKEQELEALNQQNLTYPGERVFINIAGN